MLQIKNLTIYNTKDLCPIIEDFSFVLNAQDKVVIIGEEGNGKSTLLKTIFNPSLTADYTQISGEIITKGETLGYLPQELPQENYEKSIYEYFCECNAFFDLTPNQLAMYAKDFGLTADFFYSAQRIGCLSGGEKVKTQFLRMLMGRPTILLLDEPTNDVDIATLQWLERFIAQSTLPIMFISHDETLIEGTANAVLHLERLRKKQLPRYTYSKVPYTIYAQQRAANYAKQSQMAEKERMEYAQKMETFR